LPEVQLPRQVEADAHHAAIRAALAASTRRLWPGGALHVSVLEPTEALVQALRAAAGAGPLRRGLEAATAALDAEQRGLSTLERRAGRPQGERVSRLWLFSRDGAERFYRQVERALVRYAPRVLGCQLDIDSAALGALLYGREAVVKLVMVEHKEAVSAVLRTLAP
jgi:hypothetical protein